MDQSRNDDFYFYQSSNPGNRRSKSAQKTRKLLLSICGVLLAILIMGIVGIIMLKRIKPLAKEITVEAGSVVYAEQFLSTQGFKIGQSESLPIMMDTFIAQSRSLLKCY